jgi:hypothetical protein
MPRAASLRRRPLVRGTSSTAPAPNRAFPETAGKEQIHPPYNLYDVAFLCTPRRHSVAEDIVFSKSILSNLHVIVVWVIRGKGAVQTSAQSNERGCAVCACVVVLDLVIGYIRRDQVKQSW